MHFFTLSTRFSTEEGADSLVRTEFSTEDSGFHSALAVEYP